jgi:hypothetical protein
VGTERRAVVQELGHRRQAGLRIRGAVGGEHLVVDDVEVVGIEHDDVEAAAGGGQGAVDVLIPQRHGVRRRRRARRGVEHGPVRLEPVVEGATSVEPHVGH